MTIVNEVHERCDDNMLGRTMKSVDNNPVDCLNVDNFRVNHWFYPLDSLLI